MAQPKLEAISIKLSKKIGDEVSSASAAGVGGLTAAMRLSAINDARDKLYLQRLIQLGIDGFVAMFPEFVKSISLPTDDNFNFPIDSDIKKILSATISSSTLLHFIEPGEFQDAELNPFSTYKQSSSFWVWSVFDNLVHVLPIDDIAEEDTLDGIALFQPIAAIQGGSNPDIFEPESWIPDIVTEAFKIFLADLQKVSN